MLGVTDLRGRGARRPLLRDLATEMGVPETYSTTRVGVFFGEPGETVADPYFGGEGPPRAGCIRCGACMVGCRHNAKNTLVKNYLWFAERTACEILPERTVAEIRPLGAPDGSDGYAVTSERSGAWVAQGPPGADRAAAWSSPPARSAPTSCCSAAASAARCRGSRSASATSSAPTARRSRRSRRRTTATTSRKSIAITSSFYPDADTHIENVTYGPGADSMSFLFTILTAAGTRADAAAEVPARGAAPPARVRAARCGRAAGRGAR